MTATSDHSVLGSSNMLLDPAFDAALRGRRPLAVICDIDMPDGMVRFWSGIGTLDYDGQTWTGAGVLSSIETSPKTTELRIDEVKLRLAGIGAGIVSDTDFTCRNRIARLFIVALDNAQHVVGTPYPIDEISLDYPIIELAEDGTARISLVGQSGFWTLERSTDKAWSREEGNLLWGFDTSGAQVETGFDYITSLRIKDTKWEAPP